MLRLTDIKLPLDHAEPALRRAVLGRFGHTADSAFRAMYRQLDLHDWLRHAGVDAATERAIVTWRAL